MMDPTPVVATARMEDWAKFLMLINTFAIAGFGLFFRAWMIGIDKSFERLTKSLERLEQNLKDELDKKVSSELYQSEMRVTEARISTLCEGTSSEHARIRDVIAHHKHTPAGEVIQ